jgi:hypothetical protein
MAAEFGLVSPMGAETSHITNCVVQMSVILSLHFWRKPPTGSRKKQSFPNSIPAWHTN